jgi:sugar lactone lactonase YvrE
MGDSFNPDRQSNGGSVPLWVPVAVASGVASFFAVLLVGAIAVWVLNRTPVVEDQDAAVPVPLEVERLDKVARLDQLKEDRSANRRLVPPPVPAPARSVEPETGVEPETPVDVSPALEAPAVQAENGELTPPQEEAPPSTEADNGPPPSVRARVTDPIEFEGGTVLGRPGNTVQPGDSPPPPRDMLLWTYRDRGIFAAARDGADVSIVVDNALGADGVAVCESTRTMFWTLSGTSLGNRSGSDSIQCVSAGDERVTDLISGPSRMGDIVLDEGEGRIYWSNMSERKIQRADWDGSNVEDFVVGINTPDELALDAANGYLYWSENMQGAICRAKTRNPQQQTLLEGLSRPVFGIALDVPRRQMYFVLWGAGRIMRSGLDGSSPQVVIEGLTRPDGVAVDVERGKLYWTEDGRIGRANLDGTGRETLVEGKTARYASVTLVRGPAEWLRRGW